MKRLDIYRVPVLLAVCVALLFPWNLHAEEETPGADDVAVEGELLIEGEPPVEVVEGEIEGEEIPFEGLQSVDLVFPRGDIFVPAGTEYLSVVLAAKIQGEGESYRPQTTRVYFVVNGRYIAAEGHFGELFYLPCEIDRSAEHEDEAITIHVVAYDEDGEPFVVSPVYSPQIFQAPDLDQNGFLDDPFSILYNSGDCWIADSEGAYGRRRVMMLSIFPDSETSTLIFSSLQARQEEDLEGESEGESEEGESEEEKDGGLVDTSEWSEQPSYTFLEVSNRLVEPVEQGVLIFAETAHPDALYAPYDTADMISLQPSPVVPGGNYHDIKLLLTLDQGDNFYEMPESRAVRRPLALSLVSPGTEVSGSLQYSAFPTLIDDDPEFGIGLVPAVGVWNQAGLSASPHNSASGYMQLKLSRLDVVAPFELFTPGSLAVSPSPEGGLHFGKVPVNEPSSATVTLSNPGESPVNCSVRLRDAERVFFMQTAQTLLLPPGGSSTVTLQFNPREAKEYTATLIFESSDGNYQAMTVTGTGEVADKTPGALSCSGTGKGIFFQITAGDGLLLALLGGLLLGFRRRKARTIL